MKHLRGVGDMTGANAGQFGQIMKITVEAKLRTLLDGQQGAIEGL